MPYSPDTQQFLKIFKFHKYDVTDEEYLQLCSILVKYRSCYATQKNDVGQIATPFRVRLKPNAKLQTQRPPIPNLLSLPFSLHHITPMSHFTMAFKIFPPILFSHLIFLLIIFHHLILHYHLILILLTPLPFSNASICSSRCSLRPLKHFDSLDHTYPSEKFLAHLSALVTIQLGPQPVDFQSYLTWHSRRMSLLYCSLTGSASYWYERLPQVH